MTLFLLLLAIHGHPLCLFGQWKAPVPLYPNLEQVLVATRTSKLVLVCRLHGKDRKVRVLCRNACI